MRATTHLLHLLLFLRFQSSVSHILGGITELNHSTKYNIAGSIFPLLRFRNAKLITLKYNLTSFSFPTKAIVFGTLIEMQSVLERWRCKVCGQKSVSVTQQCSPHPHLASLCIYSQSESLVKTVLRSPAGNVSGHDNIIHQCFNASGHNLPVS